MDPARKRKVRLVVALGAALLLAGTLLYTSFASSTEAKTPTQVLAAGPNAGTYELTGKVVPGSITHQGAALVFKVRDRKGAVALPVRYTGTVQATVSGMPGEITARTELTVTGGTTVLRTSGSVKIRIPLIGGKIEGFVAEQVTKLLASEADFTAKWLAERS